MKKGAPKKIPAWIESFVTYAKSKEKKRDIQNSLDLFLEIIQSRWDGFIQHQQQQQSEENKDGRPAKQRKVDPIKNLGKAMEKVSTIVDSIQDNDVLLHEIKDRMKSTVPENIKPILSEIVSVDGGAGGGGGGIVMGMNTSQISQILTETSQRLDELVVVNQQAYADISQSGSPQLEKNIVQSNKILNEVSENVNQLKELLQ